jgi:predicted house-cleaning noncanonical NTP pyrophosphatase (MazG superfamily)
MFRFKIIVIFVLLGIKGYSQKKDYIKTNYYTHVIKGDISFLNKNYKKAIKHYKKAFRKNEPLNVSPFYEVDKMSAALVMKKKEKEAHKYILWQLYHGETLEKFENDTIFEVLRKSNKWDDTKKAYPQIREYYLKKINYKLLKEVQEICLSDQLYRIPNASEEQRNKQIVIDSLNFIKIIAIFEEFGFPSNDIIGNHTVRTLSGIDITLVIRHAPIKLCHEYFIPKLKKYVKYGYVNPEDLAILIDYIQLKTGKNTIFGMFKNIEIQNIRQTNKARKRIGLYSVELGNKREKIIDKIYDL